jgi:hypothetical protein
VTCFRTAVSTVAALERVALVMLSETIHYRSFFAFWRFVHPHNVVQPHKVVQPHEADLWFIRTKWFYGLYKKYMALMLN